MRRLGPLSVRTGLGFRQEGTGLGMVFDLGWGMTKWDTQDQNNKEQFFGSVVQALYPKTLPPAQWPRAAEFCAPYGTGCACRPMRPLPQADTQGVASKSGEWGPQPDTTTCHLHQNGRCLSPQPERFLRDQGRSVRTVL